MPRSGVLYQKTSNQVNLVQYTDNIYVKIKAFFRIEFYISENLRFIDLHRIINFCPITPVRLFNTVPKYRDVACLTRVGGTHHLRAETSGIAPQIDIPITLFLGLALVASLFAPHQASSSIGFFWKLLRAVLLFMLLSTVA